MKVGIKEFTGAINKVQALVSEEPKKATGIMLRVADGSLDVCYNDGRKALIEKVNNVETVETDHFGNTVVDYESLIRAVSNCQPSGKISVDTMEFSWKESVLTVMADQFFIVTDEDGNELDRKKLSTKKMDLRWEEAGATMKSAIFARMNYDTIFEGETTDTWDKDELIDVLSRCATEKGKTVYMSTKTQFIFVANQAHVCTVPVSLNIVTDDMKNEMAGILANNGTYSEEALAQMVKDATNHIHFAVALNQGTAKAIIGILGKINSKEVYLYTKDSYLSVFVDNDEERVGIWTEMAQANKAHTGSFSRYNEMEYKDYQFTFLKDFIVDTVKSAISASKNQSVGIVFKKNEDGLYDMNIASSNAGASIEDNYTVAALDLCAKTDDIETKTFTISLQVLFDMLSQLKTDRIAMDFNVGMDGTTCLRVSEIDDEKLIAERTAAQANGALTMETLADIRVKTLGTRQYTLLKK